MLCLGQLLLVYLEALESILEELEICKEMIVTICYFSGSIDVLLPIIEIRINEKLSYH